MYFHKKYDIIHPEYREIFMHKFFIGLFLILPSFAFAAVDVSDCEVIGYQKGKMTEKDCNTVESCNIDFKDFPDDLKICLKRAKTAEDCRAYIAEQNAKIESNNLVYKCPVNAQRSEQKGKTKDHTNHDLVYRNGTPMDMKVLANDTRYVYLFHEKSGLPGFLNMGRYSIIGPAEKYGMNMVAIEE